MNCFILAFSVLFFSLKSPSQSLLDLSFQKFLSSKTNQQLQKRSKNMTFGQQNQWTCSFQLDQGDLPWACFHFVRFLKKNHLITQSKHRHLEIKLNQLCLSSLEQLHSLGQLHRSLKYLPQNITCRDRIRKKIHLLAYKHSKSWVEHEAKTWISNFRPQLEN